MLATTEAPPSTEETTGSCSLITYDTDETVLKDLQSPNADHIDTHHTGIVWVTANAGADDVSSQLQAATEGALPTRVEVLSTSSSTIPVPGNNLTVDTLPRSTGLDALAHEIFSRVHAIERTGRQPVLILDDLDQVLAGTKLTDAYPFLHVLTAKARDAGWTLRVGMEKSPSKELIYHALTPLFDQVV